MNKPSDAAARSKEAKKTKAASPKEETIEGNPLGNVWSKLQQEIAQEFVAIMATRTLQASEAAALAARRVMQRYGHADAAA
ncbi:hypothetical protein Nepgr_005475 [Nepenthes gracilis]|uniref:Uncharacterized protein n=1 Tax=Nepenthes gracilis TaxID=150966 RepID=A0AAD3S3K8_NEPGR|nr:hypothetical protein Nepgr_005475 [Nepenthes gracilis]